ncbi:MAG: UDP-N-acetylmuramate dehydrogenase [bacterium]|nr:UDP-N-acetylmuramate dehydrogenase [bacterium]
MNPLPLLQKAENVLNELYQLNSGMVRQFEPLAKRTTYRIGGFAEILYSPMNEEDVAQAIRIAKTNQFPYRILGGGSNVLINEGVLVGLTIETTSFLNSISFDRNTVIVESGAKLLHLILKTVHLGLVGLENLSGIPGTVGGGVRMNCGAYGTEISDCIEWIQFVDVNGNLQLCKQSEIEWNYRSVPQLRNTCITKVAFKLNNGDPVKLKQKMVEIIRTRRINQPLNYPSAGSVFKRPPNAYASKLIDEAGLKGLTIGGAQVSRKHAGFIINLGNAKASEVYQLIKEIRSIIIQKYGIQLELEQELWGFE